MTTPTEIAMPSTVWRVFSWIQEKAGNNPTFNGFHTGEAAIPYYRFNPTAKRFFLEVVSPYYAARWYDQAIGFSLALNTRYTPEIVAKDKEAVLLSLKPIADPLNFPCTVRLFPPLNPDSLTVKVFPKCELSEVSVSLYRQTHCTFSTDFIRLLKIQKGWEGTMVKFPGVLLLTPESDYTLWVVASPLYHYENDD